MSEQLTTITFRLPESLRDKIKSQATDEERSESGFLRFHLGRLFAMSEAETEIDELEDAQ